MSTYSENTLTEVLKNSVNQLSESNSFCNVCYKHLSGEPMPSVDRMAVFVNKVREVVFPGYFGSTPLDPDTIKYYMGVYVDEIFDILSEQILSGLCFSCTDKTDIEAKIAFYSIKSKELAAKFVAYLPELRSLLEKDVDATYVGDPAAHGKGEVIFCYPAIRAISSYRIAHKLVELEIPLIPRIISEMAHSETGIDINPEAVIGEYFTIDHGTGTVIGATCIIGNHVKLYQGVTLGAKSFDLDDHGNPIKGIPRHPIIEDDVIIYAQATILGRITIGKGSVIGGNVWVTNDMPPYSKVVQFRHRNISFIDGSGI